MNTEKVLTQHSVPLPVFRILLVEDDDQFIDQLQKFLQSFAARYYRIEFEVAKDVQSGSSLLRNAVAGNLPYDAALLDYMLPPAPGDQKQVKSIELAKYCVFQSVAGAPAASWIGQITSYEQDPEMSNFWPTQETSVRFRGGLYSKSGSDLLLVAQDMFFPEIKEPLSSEWLPAELGAVEAPVASRTSDAPEGFRLYPFIDRLRTVWPALDEETRKKALELFDIEPNDATSEELKRIGFRTFSCWEREGRN